MQPPSAQTPSMQTQSGLARAFAARHPVEAAQVLERLGVDQAVLGLAALPAEPAAGLLAHFNPSAAVHCLEGLEEGAAAALVAHLPFEVAASLLRALAGSRREALVRALPAAQAEALGRVLHYPEGSAGALMNPRVLTLSNDGTVGEALEQVRRHPEHAMYYLYLVDRRQGLNGVVNIRELMLAEAGQKLAAIACDDPEVISAYAQGADITAHPGWLSFHALPVVDEGRRLVGVLRHKALRRLKGESEAQLARDAEQIRYAGQALGELYRIGMAGMARGAFGALAGRDSAREETS